MTNIFHVVGFRPHSTQDACIREDERLSGGKAAVIWMWHTLIEGLSKFEMTQVRGVNQLRDVVIET
jgi:hypothetical protein